MDSNIIKGLRLLCAFCTFLVVGYGFHEYHLFYDPEISKEDYKLVQIQCMQYGGGVFPKYVNSYFADDAVITKREFREIEKVYNRIKMSDHQGLYLTEKATSHPLLDNDEK
jgi:hypothetical protein